MLSKDEDEGREVPMLNHTASLREAKWAGVILWCACIGITPFAMADIMTAQSEVPEVSRPNRERSLLGQTIEPLDSWTGTMSKQSCI